MGYIHIPKTAGRTIRHSLASHGLRIPQKKRGQSIHFLYHNYDLPSYDLFFASIREPVDWLMSYYYFAGFHVAKGKRKREINKHGSFDSWIEDNGFSIMKKTYGALTQSEWVKDIPFTNLIRVEHLQNDFDNFCEQNNLTKVILNTRGINTKRNRNVKPKEETIQKIKDFFAEDYELYEKVSSFYTIK